MKDFVTLSVFTYPNEYSVLQMILEQEKIRHFFQNETMIGVFPFYSNALGGIRLMVHREDLDRAKEILRTFDGPSSPLEIV